jgi:hypothetical protein
MFGETTRPPKRNDGHQIKVLLVETCGKTSARFFWKLTVKLGSACTPQAPRHVKYRKLRPALARPQDSTSQRPRFQDAPRLLHSRFIEGIYANAKSFGDAAALAGIKLPLMPSKL